MGLKEKLNISVLDIDVSSDILCLREKIKSLDTKSRYKRFRFFYNGLILSLENVTVRAYIIKPDRKKIFNDLTKINDNIVELEFTNQALLNPGILQIELVLYEDDAELSSFLLEFEVIKSIRNSDVIESTNEFNSLQIALREVEQIKNSFTDLYNEKESMLNNLYNNKETLLNDLYDEKRSELETLKNEKEQELDNTNNRWSQQFEEKYNNLNSEYAQDLTNICEKVNVNTANIANNTSELNEIKNSFVKEWIKFKSIDASLDNYYGYQKLPSGLIIQWGTVWLPDTNQRYSQKDFSFPIAFPQECLGVFADGARNNNAWFDLNATAVDLSLTSCRVMCAHINPGSTLSGQTKVNWFAMGR